MGGIPRTISARKCADVVFVFTDSACEPEGNTFWCTIGGVICHKANSRWHTRYFGCVLPSVRLMPLRRWRGIPQFRASANVQTTIVGIKGFSCAWSSPEGPCALHLFRHSAEPLSEEGKFWGSAVPGSFFGTGVQLMLRVSFFCEHWMFPDWQCQTQEKRET